MKRSCWLGTFLLLLGLPAYAADPYAETSVATQGEIVVGQQVIVNVDVYVPNFFTSPPQFPLLDIPNSIVTLPDERAQNLVKSVNGEEYSGIRRTYLVIPQIAGTYTLPQANVPLAYAGVPGQSTPASVSLPPVSFTVEGLPAEAENSAFSATDATLSQTLDGDPANLKVGDTLVRTVTLFATGTRAMMLPELAFDASDGVKLYRQSPALADDVAGPGRETGSQRLERVTYAVDREGTFTLPALAVDWFDTANRQTKRAELKPIVLTVRSKPAAANVIPPDVPVASHETRHPSFRAVLATGLGLLALLLLILLIRRWWPHVRQWVDARKAARAQSGHTRYRELLAALNAGDREAAYTALDRWTRAMGFQGIADWADTSGDRTLQDALAAFERELFGKPHPATQGSARVLTSAILGWHTRYRQHNRLTANPTPALPPLNP